MGVRLSRPGAPQGSGADAVEHALAVLRASPLGPIASDEQDRACTVLYRALLGRLVALCRKYGLDDQEAADVLHPKFVQFVTRDIHRVNPTRRDVEQWMVVVCRNATFKLLQAKKHRLERLVELDSVPEPPAAEVACEAAPDPRQPDAAWLDVPFPPNVDRERFLHAVGNLSQDDLWLFLKGLRHAESAGSNFRFPAGEVAQELGKTPGAVSVSWNRVMAKLRSACGAYADAL